MQIPHLQNPDAHPALGCSVVLEWGIREVGTLGSRGLLHIIAPGAHEEGHPKEDRWWAWQIPEQLASSEMVVLVSELNFENPKGKATQLSYGTWATLLK